MQTFVPLLLALASAAVASEPAPLPSVAGPPGGTRVGSAPVLFPPGAPDTLLFADLGSCPTLRGDVVEDCRLGYRTLGVLNERRDNAVLIPTWYGGTSEHLLRLVGEEAMVDPSRFFVILVDALGNGVSTSPSNSTAQGGAAFPRLTVADLVEAQRRLVRDHLGIERLHAVLGFSMGGFQALEWGVRFPGVAGRVVSLGGTPRVGTHDRYVFRSLLQAVELAQRAGLPPDSAGMPLATLWHVIRTTPAMEDANPADSVEVVIAREAGNWWEDFHPEDNRLQLHLLLEHDLSAAFGGDLTRTAAAVRAPMLFVVSPDDGIVTAGAAEAFAGMVARAQLLSVPSPCGHFALYCEEIVTQRVREFLGDGARNP